MYAQGLHPAPLPTSSTLLAAAQLSGAAPAYFGGFDDGNLLLHADGFVACVHASVVAQRSRTLADALARPAAHASNGMRVLQVRCGADVPLLLECLYSTAPLSWSWDADPPPLARLAALLDVATHYGIDAVRAAVGTHLDLLLPPHLSDYAGALRAHLTPGDWNPLVVWDLVTAHALPPTRFPHVATLALFGAACSMGENDSSTDEAAMVEGDEEEALRPSAAALRARDAFRAHTRRALDGAFRSGALGLEWPAEPCTIGGCAIGMARDALERRYRALAFDVCGDLPERLLGDGALFDALCAGCRDDVLRAGERLREQVWAWLCREDGEELEDPFVIG